MLSNACSSPAANQSRVQIRTIFHWYSKGNYQNSLLRPRGMIFVEIKSLLALKAQPPLPMRHFNCSIESFARRPGKTSCRYELLLNCIELWPIRHWWIVHWWIEGRTTDKESRFSIIRATYRSRTSTCWVASPFCIPSQFSIGHQCNHYVIAKHFCPAADYYVIPCKRLSYFSSSLVPRSNSSLWQVCPSCL